MTGERREEERMGLRERKKAATRRALREAAVRLTLEHGLENVTVEVCRASVARTSAATSCSVWLMALTIHICER